MKKRLGALSAAMIDAALDWDEVGNSHDWTMADGIGQSMKNADPSLVVEIRQQFGIYRIMVRK